MPHPVRVFAPAARSVTLVASATTAAPRLERRPLAPRRRPVGRRGRPTARCTAWSPTATAGRFDRSKVLLDPLATEVVFPPEHSRPAASRGVSTSGRSPLAQATPWPSPRPSRRSSRAPIVYEAHVRGMTAARRRSARRHVPGADRRARPHRRPRLHRRRAAPGAPERPAGGQLLGLHAAGVRRRAPAVRRRRRRRRRAGRADRRRPRPRPRGVDRRRLQPHDGDPRRRPDVQPPWTRRRRLLPPHRRRLVRRDDRVRQRHRHLVARRPGPDRHVARPLRRSRCRRLPLRPRPGAQPSPALRRPPRRVGGARAA